MASSFGGAAIRAMRTSGSRSTLGDAPAAVRSSFAQPLDCVGSGEDAETARLLRSTRDTSSGGDPPVWASPFSAFMRVSEAAGAAMGMGGSNLSDHESEHGVQAPASGGGRLRPGGSLLDALPKLQAATVPSAELRGPALANGLSASLVEPISFPPTSEGYVSQVRTAAITGQRAHSTGACPAALHKGRRTSSGAVCSTTPALPNAPLLVLMCSCCFTSFCVTATAGSRSPPQLLAKTLLCTAETHFPTLLRCRCSLSVGSLVLIPVCDGRDCGGAGGGIYGGVRSAQLTATPHSVILTAWFC